MKILFISRWFPYPPDNGAKLRILHLLQGIAQVHEIFLLSFSTTPDRDRASAELRAICRDVRVVLWKEYEPSSWRSFAGLFSLTPRSQADTYSAQMANEIKRILQEEKIDFVITSEWQMVAYRGLFPHHPVLYEELEVGVLYGQYHDADSPLSRLRSGLTWAKHRLFFSRLLANNQACTVVSEQERRLLSTIVPQNSSISVIPNGVAVKEYENVLAEPEFNTLIFTGSFRYRPNYDSMVWFLKNVFPLIKKQAPEVNLTITGDHGGLALPADPNVHQTGFVQDIRSLIARSWVSVAPLLEGGGTRLKILEAMAIGTPVVSTSKGAEGLDARDGEHLLIADTAEDFARGVVNILQNPALRKQLGQNAHQLIRSTYDWAVIMPEFLNVIELAASPNRYQAAMMTKKAGRHEPHDKAP